MSNSNPAVDLIPGDYRMLLKTKKRAAAWIAIAIAVGFSVAIAASLLGYKVVELDAQVRPLRDSVEGMQEWSEKLVPVAGQLKTARDRQLVVNKLLNEPFWSGFFSDLAGATNQNIWLTKTRLWKEVIINKELKDERLEFSFSITGMASSNLEVIRFMTKMSESQHISGIKLEISKVRQDYEMPPVVEFELLGTIQKV